MATTRVDQFGRVLIPKPIRDNLGLDAGTELTVQEEGDGVVLRPADSASFLKFKGKVLVFTGRLTGNVRDVIRKQREERMRVVGGMGRP
jgi:AbrB family looped-hinge helix DNA binding protein